MARDKDSLTLAKIVCFDEGSATDYIQMVNGGDATTVKEKTSERDGALQGNADAKASLKTKLLEILSAQPASRMILTTLLRISSTRALTYLLTSSWEKRLVDPPSTEVASIS